MRWNAAEKTSVARRLRPVAALAVMLAAAGMGRLAAMEEAAKVPTFLARVLKQEIRYAPLPAEAAASTDKGITVLPRYHVDDRIEGVTQSIARQRRRQQRARFSLQRGGTYLKHTGKYTTIGAVLGYDPGGPGLRLFDFAW